MSVFFSTGPPPADPHLARLWDLLAGEAFADAAALAEDACQDPRAPVDWFCGLALAYGELGNYAEAETVARTALSFRDKPWRARHALAVALMHQGRFLGALDTLGYHRAPPEILVVRAQVEMMGGISVWAHTPQRVHVGQSVTITVRPEKMHIRPTATDVNQVTGLVTDIVYIGTDTHYGILLDGGQAIRVREQNYSAESRLLAREGETVSVRFAIEAARVLTE